jgi:hypothetical protein
MFSIPVLFITSGLGCNLLTTVGFIMLAANIGGGLYSLIEVIKSKK